MNYINSSIGDNRDAEEAPYFIPGDALLAALVVVVCSVVYWWGVA